MAYILTCRPTRRRCGAPVAFVLLALLLLGGCTTFDRTAPGVPPDLEIATVRYWAGERPPTPAAQANPRAHETYNVLALSGGGPDGAYGAGLLAGLSAAGTRPSFAVVTGVSTGALMAPFVFLGASHDELLRWLFTGPHLDKLLDGGLFTLLNQPGLYRTGNIRALIDGYISADLLEAIAREHRRGRRLYIATGSLDAQRAAIWDMGAIAGRGTTADLTLFRDILTAAISVPLLFPPGALPGPSGQSAMVELHGDAALFGGFYAGVELFPDAGPAGCGSAPHTCNLYVLVHNKLLPEAQILRQRVDAIGKRALDSMVKTNLILALQATRYAMGGVGIGFHASRLRTDAPGVSPVDFDQAYMRRIYEEGYAHGGKPDVWEEIPALLTPTLALATNAAEKAHGRRLADDGAPPTHTHTTELNGRFLGMLNAGAAD